MADQPFDMPAFSQAGNGPPTGPASPVSDLANKGPVQAPQQFTSETSENADAAQALEERREQEGSTAPSRFALWGQENSVASLSNLMKLHGFQPDENYRLPPVDSKDWQDLTKGIPNQYLDRFSGAVSADQADYISTQIHQEMALANEKETTAGHLSGLEDLGFGLIDPATVASLAVPGAEFGVASRVGRVLLGAGQAGLVNAGIQAVLDAGKQTSSGYDIADAGLQGFLLGGTMHGVLSMFEAKGVAAAGAALRHSNIVSETSDLIDSGTIPADAVRPDIRQEIAHQNELESIEAGRGHADAQVSHTDERINEALANHESALRETTAGPDAELANSTDLSARDGELQEARRSLDEHSRVLSEDREAQVKRVIDEKLNVDPSGLSKNVPPTEEAAAMAAKMDARDRARLQPEAEAEVESMRAKAAAGAEEARGVMAKAQADVDRVNRVRAAESDLDRHISDMKGADTPEKRAEALPEGNLKSSLKKALKDARADQKLAYERKPTTTAPATSPPGTFGADSASAARASLNVDPAVSIDPATADKMVPQSSRATKVVNWGPFKTFSSVLRGSQNAIVRSRLGRMFGEAIAASGGHAGTVGASDYSQRLAHAWAGDLGRIEYAHKGAWMQEKGYQFLNRWSPAVQREWETELGRAVRGFGVESKAASQAAEKLKAVYRDVLKQAKEAGVAGFENVSENGNYLPRAFDFDKIKELNRQLGDSGMISFLADSMEKAGMGERLERPQIETIAKAYLQKTKQLGLGIDGGMMHGTSLDDLEAIRQLLTDHPGIDTQAVDSVINKLRADQTEASGGSVKYSKRRVAFDETHTIDTVGADGKPLKASIADLFSNEAMKLSDRYTRVMSGAIGLAKVGIKSDSDFAKSLNEAISSLGEHGASPEEIKNVVAYAKGGYSLLMGRPLDDESFGLFSQAAGVARNYAYTRSMNQAGFSIANNLVRPWTNGYMRFTNKYMPAMAELFARDEHGNLNHKLMNEIERFTGLGTDSIGSHLSEHYEGDSKVGQALSKVNYGMKLAGKVTSNISGMTPGLIAGQRLMALGITDRLVQHALGNATIPMKRLAIMGIDEGMLGRIKSELSAHAVLGDNKVASINWAQWTDLDARDAMLNGINREARILIHGEDIASTGLWMNKWWGRLAIQLRRFPMMAMSKQLGRALHMRDLDTVMDFATTGTVGAASAYAQAYLKSRGMNEQDQKAYMDKYGSASHLLAASIQRNPYSGMAPQLIDTVATGLGQKPVFDARGSGLSGNLLGGMPAMDAVQSAATSVADPLRNGPYTQKEWRAMTSMLPLGNALPMVWMTNAMADNFPKSGPKAPKGEAGSTLLDEGVNELQQ